MPAMPSPPPQAAAILDDGGTVVMDSFLTQLVRHEQALGRRVQGCVMHRPGRAEGCAATMWLVDVLTGEQHLVSQPMGTGSKACRADPQGFARASRIFRTALADSPDLVVCNRFGDLEAGGAGFHAELLEILAQGLPLLTTVAERNIEAWQAFTGGALVLPPDEAAVHAWVEQVLAEHHAA
jgi:nucleoside-triphosphatase THEP1